jgi:hypothetical protein
LDGGARGLSGSVGSDSGRSPDSVCNRNHLLGLTRKVGAGSETVAAEGGGFDNLAIDDLIRETDLKRRVRENLAKREYCAFC